MENQSTTSESTSASEDDRSSTSTRDVSSSSECSGIDTTQSVSRALNGKPAGATLARPTKLRSRSLTEQPNSNSVATLFIPQLFSTIAFAVPLSLEVSFTDQHERTDFTSRAKGPEIRVPGPGYHVLDFVQSWKRCHKLNTAIRVSLTSPAFSGDCRVCIPLSNKAKTGWVPLLDDGTLYLQIDFELGNACVRNVDTTQWNKLLLSNRVKNPGVDLPEVDDDSVALMVLPSVSPRAPGASYKTPTSWIDAVPAGSNRNARQHQEACCQGFWCGFCFGVCGLLCRPESSADGREEYNRGLVIGILISLFASALLYFLL